MREVKQGWGWVCMAGLMAALSAERGFRAGSARSTASSASGAWPARTASSPSESSTASGRTGLAREVEFKLHPSIGINHPAYVATRDLVAEHGVAPPRRERHDHDAVGNLIGDLASGGARRRAVLAAVHGCRDDRRRATRAGAVRRLTARRSGRRAPARPHADRARPRGRPRVLRGAAHRAARRDRARRRCDGLARIEFPRDRPAQGWAEIEAKFHELGRGVLDDERRTHVVETVGGLEKLDDVAELAALLAPGA